MNRETLLGEIKRKKSVLCVGLDTDLDRIPTHLLDAEDPIFEFNKQIIDATHPYAVAYKPNIAFYEAYGVDGWKSLEKTSAYLRENYPDIFTIADAKRGDIGNTSARYAKAFFDQLGFDSLTVAPYMGSDSVKPFLQSDGKWIILLALTSNPGAVDFQLSTVDDADSNRTMQLFEKVLMESSDWAGPDKMMYVVGATKADFLKRVRRLVPQHFLLVPGVGAQGGSLEEVLVNGIVDEPALLVNSSRGIIYASDGKDFAEAAAREAHSLQQQMESLL